ISITNSATLNNLSVSGHTSITEMIAEDALIHSLSADSVNLTNTSIASDLTVSGLTSLAQLNAITATIDHLALNFASLSHSTISDNFSVTGETSLNDLSVNTGVIQSLSVNSANVTTSVIESAVINTASITNTIISDALSVIGHTRLNDITAGGTSTFSSVTAQSLNITQNIIADDIASQTIIANNISITNMTALNHLSVTGSVLLANNTITVGSTSASLTLTRPSHINGSGTDFVIKGQNASGNNQKGGDILLIPGSKSGDEGENGQIIIKKGTTDTIMQVVNYMDTDNSEVVILAFKRDVNENPLITLKNNSPENITKVVIAADGNSYFNGGNVGIGNDNPEFLLTVGNNAHCDGNSWLTTSDRLSKKDIQDLSKYGTKTIQQLRPVSFRYQSDDSNRIHLGLVAQEVETILPEVVKKINGKYSIDYPQIIPVLIKALQDQQETIFTLTLIVVLGFIFTFLIVSYCVFLLIKGGILHIPVNTFSSTICRT
ncbi:MAG: tail fiber domain-containing protein, partial [Candidatus Magnetomorum sp.]|nr:tail fiber domain-containing protein [Candidatus Magnetomorum sp.]